MKAVKLRTYLRLAIGLALIAWLVTWIDVAQLGITLAAASWPLLIVALLIMLVNFFLKTYRWAYILQAQNAELTFLQLIRFNFISMFLAHFLPTSIASDFVRLYCVSRYMPDPRDAVSSIVIDRIIGLFSLAVLVLLSMLAWRQMRLTPLSEVMSWGLMVALFVSIAIPLGLQHRPLAQGVNAWLYRVSHITGMSRIRELYENFLVYQHRRTVMVNALLMSFLNLFIATIEFYVIAQSLSSNVSLLYFFVFIPLVVFLSMIPISIGGIGLLENALAFFFYHVGMSIEMCVGMAVVHRVLLITATLPGGVLMMIEGLSGKQPAVLR